jgi:hypothetical protein
VLENIPIKMPGIIINNEQLIINNEQLIINNEQFNLTANLLDLYILRAIGVLIIHY